MTEGQGGVSAGVEMRVGAPVAAKTAPGTLRAKAPGGKTLKAVSP